MHPGFVNSNFGNNNNFYLKSLINFVRNFISISTKKGSETIIYLTESDQIKNISGKYFYKKKEIKSSLYSYNEEIAKNVWIKTLSYL